MEITFTSGQGLTDATSTTLADYIGIAEAEDEALNGVYEVKNVIDYKRIVVDYTGNLALPTLDDGSTADSFGNVLKFVSVRLDSMDNVNDRLGYDVYKDKIEALETGDKVFADADSDGLWRVYEKQNPYTHKQLLSPDSTNADQDFGWQILARNDGRAVVSSAPTRGQGMVHFLFRSTASAGSTLLPQASITTTSGNDNTGKLGYSLSMSQTKTLVLQVGLLPILMALMEAQDFQKRD